MDIQQYLTEGLLSIHVLQEGALLSSVYKKEGEPQPIVHSTEGMEYLFKSIDASFIDLGIPWDENIAAALIGATIRCCYLKNCYEVHILYVTPQEALKDYVGKGESLRNAFINALCEKGNVVIEGVEVRNYDKLIRSKILKQLEDKGIKYGFRVVDTEGHRAALRQKLVEEAQEFQKDPSLEEMADVLQVVLTLAKEYGYTAQKLEEKRLEKLKKNGSLVLPVILEKTLEKAL